MAFHHLWNRTPRHLMPHWMEFMKAASKIELRGIPLDVETYLAIDANREAIKQGFLEKINQDYEILRSSGHLNMGEWLRWCLDHRVAWPYKTSPKTGQAYYAQDADTFDDMSARHPFIEKVYQTKRTIQQLNNRKTVIDLEDQSSLFWCVRLRLRIRQESAEGLHLRRAKVDAPPDGLA